MRLRFSAITRPFRFAGQLLSVVVLASLLAAAPGFAHDAAVASPEPAASAPASGGGDMTSAGWFSHIAMKLEKEAVGDVTMLPDTPSALAREIRSFDSAGSMRGALIDFGWVLVAAAIALVGECAVVRGLSRRQRLAMRARGGPSIADLLLFLTYELAGLAVFAGILIYSRHWLMPLGVTLSLVLFAANVLIPWRIVSIFLRVLLCPSEPVARLLDMPDEEARRQMRFLSWTILATIFLISFGRYGLADEDSGAPHIIGLIVAALVCACDAAIVYRSRRVAEALIRGCSCGLMGAVRDAIARVWLPIGFAGVAFLFVSFVFGLSLGLLSYYHAAVRTLWILVLLLIMEWLTERGSRRQAMPEPASAGAETVVVQRSFQRILRTFVLLIVGLALTSTWIGALELPGRQEERTLYSADTALVTLFVAYVLWELARLAIDRSLQDVATGPKLPGSNDDDEAAPGSRLQTVLPMLRVAFGVVIAVLATLIVLSHLGIDTAPLIAGAGVFGLAISFGSQSLVRDIISGLFYIWDDAFRVGEYIDTGRLKGTVEALGIRSMKLRHHNGPLHTIPYGQLGAVTNQSRDFATIKFNLRFDPSTDIELVRRTAKRIGIEMQEIPEMAAEVMLPLKMQGIFEIPDNALVLRFKFTARPVKPTWVQREYLKRMYAVFAEKGIVFASGVLTLQTVPSRGGPMIAAENTTISRAFGDALPVPAVAAAAARVA
jgi:small-conductance mechanosensitive channel